MKSWHTDKFASFGTTTLNDAISKAMQESGITGDQRYYKVVSCGRAVVIMPDSDRTADAKPGEVMKMLGANDALVKYVRSWNSSLGNSPIEMDAPKSNSVRYDYTLRNDCNDQVSYVRITSEQVAFLNWLGNNDYLHYDMDWELGHNIPDIETI